MPSYDVQPQTSGLIVVNNASTQATQNQIAEALILAQQAYNASVGINEQTFTTTTLETVTHNLGYRPIIQVIDSTGEVLDARIVHISTAAFTVEFNDIYSGIIQYR